MAPFNIWQPQGTVISQVSTTQAGQPTVLYDINPVILSANPDGHIFKMWYGSASGTSGVYYAESADGLAWTKYSGNPVIASRFASKVYKNGSTYYLYASSSFTTTNISAYTSSNGVTWTLANATAIVPTAAWEGTGVFQLAVLDIIAGTWYGYYTGNGTPGPYYEGLATSTDGINWTKSPSNPIIPTATSNFTFQKVGSTYYGWTQSGIFSNIERWSATNPSGPWTLLTSGGGIASTYYSTAGTDFYTGQPPLQSEIGDPSIVAALGNVYLYYSVGFNSTPSFYINAAIAPNTTIAQLVAAYEGVVNVPISGRPELNFTTLASDNFQRANSNPLGGNWTPLSSTSFAPAQLVSNKVEGTGIFNSDSWWNGLAWSADQWGQTTVGACAGYVGVTLRQSITNVPTAYRFMWNGTAGVSGTWLIQKVVSGVFTTLTSGTGMVVNTGDTITAAVIGSNLMYYHNDVLIYAMTDSSIASGAAGFALIPNASITDTTITAWSGGSFQNAPLIPTGTILSADGPMISALFPVLMARMRIAAAYRNRNK